MTLPDLRITFPAGPDGVREAEAWLAKNGFSIGPKRAGGSRGIRWMPADECTEYHGVFRIHPDDVSVVVFNGDYHPLYKGAYEAALAAIAEGDGA